MPLYGKIFADMYQGSMYGSGPLMFAVWGYVIANMEPERVSRVDGKNVSFGAQVELQTKKLRDTIGKVTEDEIQAVIDQLCAPDPESRTLGQEGRRLIKKEGHGMLYHVVNGEYYRKIRSNEERREYQRVKQAEYREAKRLAEGLKAINDERQGRFVEADGDGDTQKADGIAAEQTEGLGK